MTEFNRETYRDYDAINYSKLSQLAKNPSQVDEDKDWHDGMAFGSLVDLMCFEPNKVEEEFYVNDADREPSSTAKDLADWILDNKDVQIDDHGVCVKKGGNRYGLPILLDDAEEAIGSSTSFEKYGGVEYLKSQIESQDKKVVSRDLYDKARNAMRTLKTHEFTRNYFKDPRSHIEIQHQVPILWDPSYYELTLDFAKSKSLLDTVIIDHYHKIVKPVDLKTTSSSVFRFPQKVNKWGYYLQAAYYHDALKYKVDHHDGISDYDVLPTFDFVVISSKNLNSPLIWTATENDLKVGREGGVLSFNDREVRGWIQLIKDLKWHEKHNKWNYPREVYENNGKVELDVFE